MFGVQKIDRERKGKEKGTKAENSVRGGMYRGRGAKVNRQVRKGVVHEWMMRRTRMS